MRGQKNDGVRRSLMHASAKSLHALPRPSHSGGLGACQFRNDFAAVGRNKQLQMDSS